MSREQLHSTRGPRRGRPDFESLGFDPSIMLGGRRGRRGGPGRRPRGGDVRAAALLILSEHPAHGYQLITEIAERSNGVWKPSPGSIYPVLQLLEDEGLIAFESTDGRKTARLTGDGQSYVDTNREELGEPWATDHHASEMREFVAGLKPMISAWSEVAKNGTPVQRQQATVIIEDARRQLYRVLSEG